MSIAPPWRAPRPVAGAERRRAHRPLLFRPMYLTPRTWRKVPQVTIFFWIIKVLTTAMGEATSDYSVHRVDPVFAVA